MEMRSYLEDFEAKTKALGDVREDKSDLLEERVAALRETMSQLKKQLNEEKMRWKAEMEEMNRLLLSAEVGENGETLPAGDSKFPPSNPEKRLNMRRQVAVNTYCKRLSEVEKLCQEELARVQESATHLEPLKQMSSRWWNKEATRNDMEGWNDAEAGAGEVMRTFDVPVTQINTSLVVDEDVASEIEDTIRSQINHFSLQLPSMRYSTSLD